MRHQIVIALVSGLLVCSSGCANDGPKENAEEDPKNIEFHRKNAGEPDREGWCDARSTKGDFSVRIPSLFNDFTQDVQSTKNGGKIVNHVIGAKNSNGVKYIATAMSSPDGKAFPESYRTYLEEFASKEAAKGTLKSRREIVWEGQTGVELYIKNAKTTTKIRGVELDGTRYTVAVEFPNSEELDVLPNVDRFLNSLKLLRNNQ